MSPPMLAALSTAAQSVAAHAGLGVSSSGSDGSRGSGGIDESADDATHHPREVGTSVVIMLLGVLLGVAVTILVLLRDSQGAAPAASLPPANEEARRTVKGGRREKTSGRKRRKGKLMDLKDVESETLLEHNEMDSLEEEEEEEGGDDEEEEGDSGGMAMSRVRRVSRSSLRPLYAHEVEALREAELGVRQQQRQQHGRHPIRALG